MYKKKKIDKKNIYIISIIVILVFVSSIIYILKKDRNLNPFEKVIKDTCLTISSTFYKPVTFIKNKINEAHEKKKIYKKYKVLEEKYNATNFDSAKMKELEKENNELKKLLELKDTLSEYQKINATVVNRDVGYWYDTITIDKGESSGIEKGMAVVTNEGLIGKVVNTSYLYSTVKLLTSDELGQKVSVKISLDDNNYVYGLLSSYDQDEKSFVIEGISENVDIKEGAMVTTTGMSSIFPSGILIGYIKGVKKDNFDLTMLALAKASYNVDNITYVSVLKRNSETE